VVSTEAPLPSRPSTTNDEVTASKTAASPMPARGSTKPGGRSVTAGEAAADAGEIVGGGLSVCFEQAAEALNITMAATL
jgi:hypothetical protein